MPIYNGLKSPPVAELQNGLRHTTLLRDKINMMKSNKIFQPFFTTKPTGQETGLSLSYDIVKAHGGEIKVETKEGEGSVFNIHIPIN
jgi:light-regulated signal transduction histidine kinase (bacteriophytochrome)